MSPANAVPGRETGPALEVLPGGGGLVATNLGKRFKKRPVVRNVSLSVQRGEAVGLPRSSPFSSSPAAPRAAASRSARSRPSSSP